MRRRLALDRGLPRVLKVDGHPKLIEDQPQKVVALTVGLLRVEEKGQDIRQPVLIRLNEMKNIEAGGQFPVPVQSRLFGRGDVMTRDTKKPVEMNTGERRGEPPDSGAT